MKHLNLIGASLAASLSISVITACDSRGVTAMKSRTYTTEERALAKAMHDRDKGLAGKSAGDQASPSATPSSGQAATPNALPSKQDEDEVGAEHAGQARTKNFFEGVDKPVAKKDELLQLAKLELGKVNPRAADLLKGVTILDQGMAGRSALALRAVVMLDGHAKLLDLPAMEIRPGQNDLVNGVSGFPLVDANASNVVAKVDASKLLVASLCASEENDKCVQAILLISWPSKDQKSADTAMLLVELSQAGGRVEIADSNVGMPVKSYEQALADATKLPAKDDKAAKPGPTLQELQQQPAAEPKAPVAVATKNDLLATSRNSRQGQQPSVADLITQRQQAKDQAARKNVGPLAEKATPAPANVATTTTPTLPTKAEAKQMTYKEYAARYQAWKKAHPGSVTTPTLRRPGKPAATTTAPAAAPAAKVAPKPADDAKPTGLFDSLKQVIFGKGDGNYNNTPAVGD